MKNISSYNSLPSKHYRFIVNFTKIRSISKISQTTLMAVYKMRAAHQSLQMALLPGEKYLRLES